MAAEHLLDLHPVVRLLLLSGPSRSAPGTHRAGGFGGGDGGDGAVLSGEPDLFRGAESHRQRHGADDAAERGPSPHPARRGGGRLLPSVSADPVGGHRRGDLPGPQAADAARRPVRQLVYRLAGLSAAGFLLRRLLPPAAVAVSVPDGGVPLFPVPPKRPDRAAVPLPLSAAGVAGPSLPAAVPGPPAGDLRCSLGPLSSVKGRPVRERQGGFWMPPPFFVNFA